MTVACGYAKAVTLLMRLLIINHYNTLQSPLTECTVAVSLDYAERRRRWLAGRIAHLAGNVRVTGYSDCWLIACPVTASTGKRCSERSISWALTWCQDWYDSSALDGHGEDAAERRQWHLPVIQVMAVFRVCRQRRRRRRQRRQVNDCVVVSHCWTAPTWSLICRSVHTHTHTDMDVFSTLLCWFVVDQVINQTNVTCALAANATLPK